MAIATTELSTQMRSPSSTGLAVQFTKPGRKCDSGAQHKGGPNQDPVRFGPCGIDLAHRALAGMERNGRFADGTTPPATRGGRRAYLIYRECESCTAAGLSTGLRRHWHIQL